MVLLCKDSAEHREWRQALLKLQTEINENEEQREVEAEVRERLMEEEAKRLIAERKQRKLERRRSAETPKSSNGTSPGLRSGIEAAPSTLPTPAASSLSAVGDPLLQSASSPPQPLKSLSPSGRSLSDVTVSLSPLSYSHSVSDEDDPASLGRPSDWKQRKRQSSQQQQTGSFSETDEDGNDFDDGATQLDHGSLMVRRASTRSMSLDESEMSAMRANRMGRLQSFASEAAAGVTPTAAKLANSAMTPAGAGSEHRKMTDPTPGSHLSATPSMYPSAVQQREKMREEDERAKRAEEKANLYLKAQKNKAYIKLFSLPDSEELICDYSCAVQRAILLHGRMYVSEHFVCFFSSIFSHKTSIVLPMDDVLFVASAKVALVFDNSLKVNTHDSHAHMETPVTVGRCSQCSKSMC